MEEKIKDSYEKDQEWEIDFRSYFKKLVEERRVLAKFIFFALTIAFIATLISPRSYWTEMVVEIGLINGQPVDSVAALAEKINLGVFGSFGGLEAVPASSSNLVVIKTKTTRPEEAELFLKDLGRAIVEESNLSYQEEKSTIEKEISRLSQKNRALVLEKNNLEQKESFLTTALEENSFLEQTSSFLLQLSLFDVKTRIGAKQEEIDEILFEISDLEEELLLFKPSKIIKEPVFYSRSLSKELSINFSLAAILGLTAGVAFVFLKPWWKEVKSNKSQAPNSNFQTNSNVSNSNDPNS